MYMDKLNLEIEKYSISELKDIFDIIEINDTSLIKSRLDSMIITLNNDTKIGIEHKGNIIKFLNKAYNKICGESRQDNSSFFSSPTTNMISNAPENHPLIQSANKIGGQSAKIYEGRGGENFPAGFINPINIRTTKQNINVDSIFRENYNLTNSSQFSIDMPQTIKGVVEMQLASIQIPLTLYSINKYCNNFKIVYNNVPFKVILEEGNYLSAFSSNSFNTEFSKVDIIEKLNNENLFLLNIDGTEIKMTASLNMKNGIVQIELNTIGGIEPATTLDPTEDLPYLEFIDSSTENIIGQLGWILGFKKNKYFFQLNNNKWVIIGDAPIAIDQPKYLYFCVNDFTNASSNQYVVPLSESILSPYILYKIDYQTLVQSAGIFNFGGIEEPYYGNREYFGPVDIKKLQFTFIDEFGRVVDFNNRDWSAQLAFTRMYE